MIKRFSISVGGRIVAAILQIFVVALTARSLGVEDFGIFASVSSIALVTLAVFDLGAGIRVLRISTDPDGGGTLATLAILRLILFFAIPVAAIAILGGWSANALLTIAACVYVVGESLGDLLIGLLQGMKRSGVAMTTLVLRRALPLVIMLVWPSPIGALAAVALAGVLGLATFVAFSAPLWRRPRSPLRILRENWSLVASGGAANLAQLDVPLVTLVAGAEVGGLYAAAVRLFNPINLLISTLMQIVVPELSSISEPSRRMSVFIKARRAVIFFALTLAAASPLAPVALSVFYGSEFSGGGPAAVAVFLSAAVSAVAQLYLSWFYAIGVPTRVPIGMLIATTAGLAVITGLTNLGITGSAIGLFIMHCSAAGVIVLSWHAMRGKQVK